MGKASLARVYELDRLIREKRYPSREFVAAEFEVSVKTVQRDIDFLRDQMGAPVEFDRSRRGYFYTEPNYCLPYIHLSDRELSTLLLARHFLEQSRAGALADEMDCICRRVAGPLPDRVSAAGAMIPSAYSFHAPPAMPIGDDIWSAVLAGLRDSRVIDVMYEKKSASAPAPYALCPYHLANLQGDWYMLAGRADDGRPKQYALARIRTARVTRIPFERPADFHAPDWLDNAFGRFLSNGQAVDVRVRFSGESARWIAARRWHPKQRLEPCPDGSVVLSFPVTGGGPRPLFNVSRWILSFGREARVLAPAELKRLVAEEVAALAFDMANGNGYAGVS